MNKSATIREATRRPIDELSSIVLNFLKPVKMFVGARKKSMAEV